MDEIIEYVVQFSIGSQAAHEPGQRIPAVPAGTQAAPDREDVGRVAAQRGRAEAPVVGVPVYHGAGSHRCRISATAV